MGLKSVARQGFCIPIFRWLGNNFTIRFDLGSNCVIVGVAALAIISIAQGGNPAGTAKAIFEMAVVDGLFQGNRNLHAERDIKWPPE